MKKLSQFFRLLYIHYIIMRHGLDQVVLSAPLFSRAKFLRYLNPWRGKQSAQAVAIRIALEKLGPLFVKFGQMLSTRRDLFPDDIVDELAKLQDSVPPFSSDLAQKIIEQTYGQPVTTLFADFQALPLASASIAQVHTATLLTGEAVVIKLRRPDIEKQIRRDIALLYSVAGLAQRFWRQSKRFRLNEVVAEFERTLLAELDFMREAANAAQLRRNFNHSVDLYVPEIYWDYTRENILVMERIYGIAVSDIATLNSHQIDLKKLAAKGVEIFFTQVLRDGFFHADMHPGNIFVATKNPLDSHYIAVDFGIMGTLSQENQRYLAENLLAFFKRDYQRVALLHLQSGWVPADTSAEEFAASIRTVCEPIFEKPLRDISFAQLLLRLFQTAGRFNMEVQPQLLLLQKTLFHVEGLGRQLYPDLDLWATAQPFLERWLKQQYGVKTMLRKMIAQAPYWLEKLPEIPDLIYQQLQKQSTPPATSSPPQDCNVGRNTKTRKCIVLALALMLCVIATVNVVLLTGDQVLLMPWSWLLVGVGVGVACVGWLLKNK